MNAKPREALQSADAAAAVGCRELGRALLERASERKAVRAFRRKQVLYYEGAAAQGVYCVESGLVKVYKIGPEGKQHILRIAHRDDVIGLESIFAGDYYVTEAEMMEEGRLCFIDRQIVFRMARDDAALAMRMMRCLSAQLVLSDEERVDLAQHSVKKRMARLLSALSRGYGVSVNRGTRITLRLSREEIAEMIGSAAETAMRLLKEFREEHVLEVRGREITVLNQSRLASLADMRE